MPKIYDIEYTPNPAARKIVLKEPITAPGVSLSFSNLQDAAAHPLAEALLAIPHVKSVFMMDRFITITKDNEVEWDELLRQVAIPIRAAEPVSASAPAAPNIKRGKIPTLTESTTFWMRGFVRVWRAMVADWKSSVTRTTHWPSVIRGPVAVVRVRFPARCMAFRASCGMSSTRR